MGSTPVSLNALLNGAVSGGVDEKLEQRLNHEQMKIPRTGDRGRLRNGGGSCTMGGKNTQQPGSAKVDVRARLGRIETKGNIELTKNRSK